MAPKEGEKGVALKVGEKVASHAPASQRGLEAYFQSLFLETSIFLWPLLPSYLLFKAIKQLYTPQYSSVCLEKYEFNKFLPLDLEPSVFEAIALYLYLFLFFISNSLALYVSCS